MKPRRPLVTLAAAALLVGSSAAAASAQSLGQAIGSVAGIVSSSETVPGDETTGSLNTAGSLGIGEPTLGSAPASVQDLYTGLASDSVFADNGTIDETVSGSLDSRFCGEPTAMHVVNCIQVIAGSAEGNGPSDASGSLGSASGSNSGSLVLGASALGSAALIGGAYWAISTGAVTIPGVELPPLPGL